MKPRCTTECAQEFRRLEKEKSELALFAAKRGGLMATEFAWVIEKGSAAELSYYAPTAPGEWTKDHLQACRFARKEDAEAVQFRHVTHGHLPERNTRVCEHGWG